MSVIVEAAGVYSAIIDELHPVGSIRRVGGGDYVFVPGDGTAATDPGDYETATAAADAFVANLEKDPQASGDALTVKKLSAELAAANERIRILEAKLTGAVLVDAVVEAVVKG